MDKKMKVGIIGAGRIGQLHATAIVKNFPAVEVVAIVDIYADKVKEWAHSLRIANVYDDYKQSFTILKSRRSLSALPRTPTRK
ncbi:Hypothetical protein LUCI_0430 [Lucifera butyrica]|uniref:Gfo/Idh/MocA-like oxidoreductase N-terminal domain-containing protein n=1 Tax=Lucifera butyrica TaxID=1351585 RepID=A0A498R4W0_9FIRM|nr:Gfo/Idh/MocA family oxidoreductase [Lucifera butyrica]VBB05223.1 Hypothetical protein LUCI_0430 [Lucifera butyrica]